MSLSSITVITQPSVEPVTLSEAKAHCRISTTDEDVLIGSLIQAARSHVEKVTHRSLVTTTLDAAYHYFSQMVELPAAPLQSVTSVKYLDSAGDEQTLDTSVYRVDANADPGRLSLDYGQSWPSTYMVPGAVTVRIVAGYGDSGTDVPIDIRQVILLLIGHWYENREATIARAEIEEIPLAVSSLLSPYIVEYF